MSVAERLRPRLPDGAATTVHVARFRRDEWSVRVVALDPCSTVLRWCAANGAEHAIVGGFYVRPGGPPLGDLWIDGRALPREPFTAPWGASRACVHVDEDEVSLLSRAELDGQPRGDLLQAGPMLAAGGGSLIVEGGDPEGFSSAAAQFDSDITVGRYPRAAFGVNAEELIAVACDGRADDDAGMTLAELAMTMLELGAEAAINLDGGGSASLVVGGSLVNSPRSEHGRDLDGGREVATALRFVPRA